MGADHTVTANFRLLANYDLTMAVDPAGSGTTNPTVGVHNYLEGTVVPITATSAAGYVFDHWTGDVADANSASTTATMDGNKTVTAAFAEAVTVDGAVDYNTADANSSSLAVNHTTGAGPNRLMLVGVSWNCGSTDQSISSVTFTPDGGTPVNLTAVRTEQTGTQLRYSAIYSLLSPPSEQTGTVTVTFSGAVSNGIVAGVANFAGADQTTPLGTPNGANGNSTAPSVDLTGLNGDELVFDNVFQGASNSSQTLTVGPSQSQLWNAFVSNTRAAASTEQATGGSVTMSWTAASASYWAIVAVPINPAPPAPTCYALTLGHTGSGSNPVASPANSDGCTVGNYIEGESISLSEASPFTGYHISGWNGTANDNSTASTNSLTMSASAHEASVIYAIDTFTLTYNAGTGGALTGDTSQTVNYGVDGTAVEAVPDTGYHFAKWSDDSTANPRTDTHVTANLDVTATFAMDEAYALTLVQDGTTLTGTLGNLTATFPASIPAVLVDLPYKINSKMTLAEPLPAGSTVSIMITVNGAGPFPYVTNAPIPGTTFWVTELFDPEAPEADFDGEYGGRIEVYSITINSGGGNPTAIDTEVKIESIISKDEFATEVELAEITLPIHLAADEDAALALVQDGTTLSGTLGALTATFPTSIPAVIVAEPYKINSRMTLADPLPAGSTVTIMITVNGSGPFPYVTNAPIPASPFWVTDLFDPAAVAADFDGGYGGRIELYSITINSGGGNPVAIDTTVKIESIISKDGFTPATNVVLDEITLPVHVDADLGYALTINTVGNGTVVADPSAPYYYGTEVTLTATADTGWTFTGWSGAGCSGTGTCSITMDDNKSVTATFTQNVYTLTINKVGNGTVVAAPLMPYHYGDAVTLTATADTGWTFNSWSGACAGIGSCSVTMDDNKTVTATFTINTFTITASAGANGGITPSGAISVNYGASQSFTITPNSGYHVADVLVDGGSVAAVTSYQFTNVQANHTIAASFVPTAGEPCFLHWLHDHYGR